MRQERGASKGATNIQPSTTRHKELANSVSSTSWRVWWMRRAKAASTGVAPNRNSQPSKMKWRELSGSVHLMNGMANLTGKKIYTHKNVHLTLK